MKNSNFSSKMAFYHACTEMAIFFPETREENPLFGVHTKNAGVINNSRIWGTIAWFALAPWFFCHFCTIKCRHLTDQKVNSLRKLESMGSQLHRCESLQLVMNCFCRIFWLTFFVCTPKREFSSRVLGKRVAISVHAWEKIKYATRKEQDDSHSWFCASASLVHNFTLVRIILFLPGSINIYYCFSKYPPLWSINLCMSLNNVSYHFFHSA